MATRSVVAIPAGDGWIGRYVHWDGSPGSRVPLLLELVARDGIDKVRQTIVSDHYGWSHLHPEQGPEIAESWYQDGRFIAVPGYGLAYTREQAGGDEMMTDTTSDPVWIEYVYVLGPHSITVLHGSGDKPGTGAFTLVTTVRYSDALVGA